MEIVYSKKYEDIIFGLRFLKTIKIFKKSDSGEIVLRNKDMVIDGLRHVLYELKNNTDDDCIKKTYLGDDAIAKAIKLHENSQKFLYSQLKHIPLENNDISIFDTVAFAIAYKGLMENRKISEKETRLFFAIQEKLSSKINFIKYTEVNFEYADIRVGKIIEIKPVENSDKLFVEKVFIDREVQILSGLRNFYKESDLLNKKFLFLVNVKPVFLAGLESGGMILCANSEGKVETIEIPEKVEVGTRLKLDIDGFRVIEEFEHPVIDLRKNKAKEFMKNLRIEEHRVVFGKYDVLCNGDKIKTKTVSGSIS